MAARTKSNLSTIPLREWPPEALMREAKRTAGLWCNHPAFSQSNGGLFSNREERADEIAVRVLDYLRKKPAKDALNQVTFFHQIARYCQPGIVRSNYAIPSVAEGVEGAGDDETDYPKHEIVSPDTAGSEEETVERRAKLENLTHKLGIGERDVALFQTSTKDWVSATGLCERTHREMKSDRKKEIAERIAEVAANDEILLEMKKAQARWVRDEKQRAAVKMFYYTHEDGLLAAEDGKSASKPGAMRFHCVGSEHGQDEYEAKEWEPGGNWVYKCRVRVDSAPEMDMHKILDAIRLAA